ncbi:MAG: hypothetical protein ACRDJ9_27340 [Dehalococcoidia bacterium]
MRSTPSADDERGSGLISSLFGVLAFLGFLLFAVQLLLHLYSTSIVSAAAFDAARMASAQDGPGAASAESHGRSVLGGLTPDRFDVSVGGDTVTVRVQAQSPALVPALFGRLLGFDSIDESVTVRRERPVQAAGSQP